MTDALNRENGQKTRRVFLPTSAGAIVAGFIVL